MASPGSYDSISKYQLNPVRSYLKCMTIYETRARWYIIASDPQKQKYRVLKIDRTLQHELSVVEDPIVYSFADVQDLLTMIGDANGQYGGIKKAGEACSILGFVRFLRGYYMIVATKRKCVGTIGKHKIYSIEATQDYYLPNAAYLDRRRDSNTAGVGANVDSDEEKYRSLFLKFDLTKDFYFSYTYDLSSNLQHNMTRPRSDADFPPYTDMFVWNHFLLEPFHNSVKSEEYRMWLCPIIHGSFVQHKIDAYGKVIQMTLIARRSRLFAGARFLKRGINEQGYCANDVETEQIICEPSMGCLSDNHFTSFVQHRGSIPLYWAQINGGVMPKPPIIVQRVDPFHNATILHFMDLFRRYGSPITVLNLVRSKEKSPREMILREAFGQAVEFINSSIEDDKHKLIYMAWDFKKAAKNNRSKLQRDMMAIAQLSAGRIGFFHSGKQLQRNFFSGSGQTLENIGRPSVGGRDYPATDFTGRLQTGVVRTNCIDSIDRTNAAQYLLGLCMLGHQLYAMGLLSAPQGLSPDSDISLLLLDMYEMVGHQLALQYGGSGLAHTMNTFNSKSIVDTSKDFWTTIQRYYSNTFTDQEKQNSINLFLGVFKPWQTDTRLWALETDYFLHMADYCKELLYICRWWEEPLHFFNMLRDRPFLTVHSPENRQRNRAEFEHGHSTYKMTEFDKVLGSQHNLLRKVAICKRPKKPSASSGPHTPTTSNATPAISVGIGGIMRWLWSPRSDSKVFEDIARQRDETVVPDYSGSQINPLAEFGMRLSTKDPDISLFSKYADVTKLAHRQRKRRKRYTSYRAYSQRTHYRRPTIFADSIEQSETRTNYANYVTAFNSATFAPLDAFSSWEQRDKIQAMLLRPPVPNPAPLS